MAGGRPRLPRAAGRQTVSEPEASATQRALEEYSRFLQRTREMGVVGHRGGLTATKALLAMCDLREGHRILEVGCGSGYTACTAAREHGVAVVAADREAHLLARTAERTRALRLAERVTPVQADARRLPFADASFDGLICESVLAFLGEAKTQALSEFHRVLRPGGFLANNEVTFTKTPPDDFLAAMRGAARKAPNVLVIPVQPDEHRRLLEGAGFAEIRVETGDLSTFQQMMEQMQIDGFRALQPFLASLFDREMRRSVYRKEMALAQRTFEEHTGYGLYVGRKAG